MVDDNGPENELKLYDDPGGAKLTTRIDLGRIPVGEETSVVKYLKNNSPKWPMMNIALNETDPEVTVDFPQMLKPNSIKPVKITFRPSMRRRIPLNIQHLFVGELWIG